MTLNVHLFHLFERQEAREGASSHWFTPWKPTIARAGPGTQSKCPKWMGGTQGPEPSPAVSQMGRKLGKGAEPGPEPRLSCGMRESQMAPQSRCPGPPCPVSLPLPPGLRQRHKLRPRQAGVSAHRSSPRTFTGPSSLKTVTLPSVWKLFL